MDDSPTIEDAIALAVAAHRRQLDKAGKPYILHPLRVMLRFKDPEEMITAVLHDVIEDTEITLRDLREQGYSERVLQALAALTRREDETYADFIDRAAKNPLARRIKLADLADNMNLHRLPAVTEADCRRLARYKEAWKKLDSPAPDG